MRRNGIIAALCAALALPLAGACTGSISGPGSDDDPGIDDPAGDAPRFARLTHDQWENTVADLFGMSEPPGLAGQFQPDPPIGRFDNNILRLTVTAGHWQDYQRAAELIAEQVVLDTALLGNVVPADLPADTTEAGRAFITSFGRRAFRRPLSAAEVDRYAALFAQGSTHFPEHDDLTAGIRLVIEAMLQSPYFLYRAETSSAVSGGEIALSGDEVASRLSYALWNSMPDAELMAAADAGDLETADGVRAQAARLFESARTSGQFDHFHFQAFELLDWADLDKDAVAFPDWRREVGVMMQTEATRFLGSVVAGGTIRDLMTSRTAFVNDELAAIYGVDGSFDASFQEVELDANRAGFITRAGFLTRNATLTDPDPIHRGVFINLNLLCVDLSALPNIPDDLNPVGDTNRERIESITGDGTCGEGCHSTTINPLGFALENYDALGQYRTEDNGFPVDAADSYQFPDRTIEFNDAIELSQQLAEAPELHACYIQQLLEYVYGRDITEADQPIIDKLAAESLAENLTIREIILRLVTSRAFRYRTAN
jgi:hypothetical protein